MTAFIRRERPTASDGLSRRSLLRTAGIAAGVITLGIDLTITAQPAHAAGKYLRPCGDIAISDSWQGHKNRNPPSGEPGTDYGIGRHTPVLAATSGVIVDAKHTNSTATGRYIALQADDGNYLRYLHLDRVSRSIGARVARGDTIALSGASGFGDDAYYGPHAHVSLWVGTTPWKAGFAKTADFEKYTEPSRRNTEIIRRNNNMASFFHIANYDGSHTWALAGDGTGSAAWLQTMDRGVADALALQHGEPVTLDWGLWQVWKAAYLAG